MDLPCFTAVFEPFGLLYFLFCIILNKNSSRGTALLLFLSVNFKKSMLGFSIRTKSERNKKEKEI